jgi:hypothetical protein
LLGALITIALIVRIAMKKIAFSLPKFKWHDALLVIFAISGFLSSIVAENKTLSLKQSVVALSFVVLYFLVRIYIQSLSDLKRIVPFFLSSAIIVAIYGILQNVIFIHGGNSFEVMPGRPNATFTEADWSGIFLVFLLTVLFVLIYKNTCHSERSVAESKNLYYILLITSRSFDCVLNKFRTLLRMTVFLLSFPRRRESSHRIKLAH